MLRENLIGIVGGLGPLASAEFLKTIYEHCGGMPEQEMPRIFMYSDPSFPERSETRSGNFDEEILTKLQEVLQDLDLLNVSGIIIGCITIHHLLPRLSVKQRKKIISLVDLIFERLIKLSKPHVVLCSTRTSNVQLFQRHPSWPIARQLLIFPDQEDQSKVQNFIVRLKAGGMPDHGNALLDRFVKKYGTRHFICGCTEMHLMAKYFKPVSGLKPRYVFLDPLTIYAKSLAANSG